MKASGARRGCWVFVAGGVLVLAAGSGCQQPRADRQDAPGQLRAALLGAAPVHDVTSIRFKVVQSGQSCGGSSLGEVDRPLESEVLPPTPGSGDGQHLFADALFLLVPRAYHVCATPWSGDHPSTQCDRAEGEASVIAEATTELVLDSQCRGNPKGGLGVVGVLNDPPHIDTLAIRDSKFIAVCERATLSVSASDVNGDALSYAWAVMSAPAGAAPALAGTGSSATFVTNVAGDYQLKVTVTDTHNGRAALTFPIHVSATGVSPPVCGEGTFSPTGSMSVDRIGHAMVLLADGRVLVVGGIGHQVVDILASAELYDPATRAFTSTGDLRQARHGHTATLLPNGKVLVTGGFAGLGTTLASAEVWDPATGLFSPTGDMTIGRLMHTATLLENGKVLIVGGSAPLPAPLETAELYDPATGSFTATGSMAVARMEHSATLLESGKVLVAGGYSGWFSAVQATAELYNPNNGTFTPAGSMRDARASHTATRMANGEVLIAGGDTASAFTPIKSVERYLPATGTFSPTADLVPARAYHSATLLPNGLVLVAGGQGYFIYLADAQLYDPISATFFPTGSLPITLAGHKATLLFDGTVLGAGGGGPQTTAGAVLYLPGM